MLAFDEKTGFSVSEVADVRAEVAAEWQAAFAEDGKPALDTAPETPAGQLIDSQTAAITQKDAELAFLARMFDPKTAVGVWQDALAKIYFLTRKPAINSRVVCTLTGAQGTAVAAGALIASVVDGTRWALESDVTIPAAGVIDAVFVCETAGTIAAAAGTLSQIVTITPGWDSVTNTGAATVGQLEETQAAFEARRFASVALNSRSADASVFSRVGACDGVISVFVRSNRGDEAVTIDGYTLKPHSLYCAVTGGDDEEIARAIYESLSAGCDYNGNTSVTVRDSLTGAVEVVTFERPAAFNVFLRIVLQDGAELPDGYEGIIREAVKANFYGESDLMIADAVPLRVKMFDDVFASRFLPAILNAGIDALLGVQIGADGVNWDSTLHIPIDADPVLADENILIELE